MTTTETIPPIPQWFNGIQYRSTLEARWAIFFAAAGITADYEPEGYVVGGRPYRPDFLLRDCATWVEIKGDPGRLDLKLMHTAALELPRLQPKLERGPRLLLLGNMPPPVEAGEWGYVGLSPAFPAVTDDDHCQVEACYYGFANYKKNLRLWYLDGIGPSLGMCEAIGDRADFALEPMFFDFEYERDMQEAYATARAHRFGRR